MSELVSSKQIEDLVNKIVEEKLENYFRMSRPGFEIVSGHKVPGHGIGEFCITTDTTQGLHFYEGGRAKMGANQSIEIYGGDGGAEDGKINKKEDYGVVVEAINGSVLIKATNDLVLEGAQVKIRAIGGDDEDDPGGVLKLNGDKIIQGDSPSIAFIADNADFVGILETHIIGGSTDIYGETSVEISEGVDDLLSTSVVDRLTKLSDDIKRIGIFDL